MIYKVGDIVKLKTLEKLLKLKKEGNGFYIQSGLYINSEMYRYLGKTYKINAVLKRTICHNGIGYSLSLPPSERGWVWDELCFETSKQLEFEF